MARPLNSSAVIRAVANHFPQVIRYLRGRALAIALTARSTYKTYDYFLRQVEGLIKGVYYGYIGGEFVDGMYSLIAGQLYDAYANAWIEDGNQEPLPDFLEEKMLSAVVEQQDHVAPFYRDIVDARVDDAPIDPLLARAPLWANNWNSQYNYAKQLIASETGGKLKWVEGDTEDKCSVCLALDGIVAYASEWEEIGVWPQNPPNSRLECGGWRCQCELVPTDERKTRDAMLRIERAIQ